MPNCNILKFRANFLLKTRSLEWWISLDSISLFSFHNCWFSSYLYYLLCGCYSHVGCFAMNSSEMPLQGLTATRQLYQLITKMPEDEKHTLLRFLKGATLKDKGQRKHVRKLVHTPVRYTHRAGLSSGVIRDISLGGAFILSRRTLTLQKNLSVSFFPSNVEKTVWITGDVVRVTPEGFGVRFRSIDETQKAALTSLGSTQ